ncbi:acyl-CoA dehydrogenase family protein [Mycolicibacterium thermoresistibile]
MKVADTEAIVADFDTALTEADEELAHIRIPESDLGAQLTKFRTLMNWLFDNGWVRWGWPEQVGGIGGSPLVRAAILERLALRGYEIPYHLQTLEVVGPAVAKYAPGLAARLLPAALRGDELWSQGFSEPEAGSDLASLRTRITCRDDGSFVVSGQKIWTSYGPYADRMLLLGRTGPIGDRHRGLTMLLIDLDADGVERRPIALASGREELAEFFFTDVAVPPDRLIGEVGGGWAVAMDLLQYERGGWAWMRTAMAVHWLNRILADGEHQPTQTDPLVASVVGQAYLDLAVLRARATTTLRRLASDEVVGPQTSVDKLLLSTAEQSVMDAAVTLLPTETLLGDSPADQFRRENWWYSRAASIYGGAREIQRGIIADRILRMPREGLGGR